VALAATESMHAIQFGTAPLHKQELERITELLEALRAATGDFTET
jgi:hypothetical protein